MASIGLSRCGVASVAFGAALLFAIEAARRYSLPNLLSFSGSDVTHEADFWCSVVSGALALGAVVTARSAPRVRPATAGERIWVALALLGLTPLLLAIWWSHVLYYAVFIAPSHALAMTSLFVCFQRRREER